MNYKVLIVILLSLIILSCIERQFNNPFDPDNWEVRNLTVNQLEHGSIEISWYWFFQGEDGFKIDKKINHEDWIISYAETTDNEFLDINHELAVELYYRVYAFNGSIESPKSQIFIYSSFSMIAPSSLTSTLQNQSTTVKLHWEDNSSFEENFIIERKEAESSFEQLGIVDQNITNYSDVDVESGTTYTYRCCAFHSLDTSNYSNEVSIIIP